MPRPPPVFSVNSTLNAKPEGTTTPKPVTKVSLEGAVGNSALKHFVVIRSQTTPGGSTNDPNGVSIQKMPIQTVSWVPERNEPSTGINRILLKAQLPPTNGQEKQPTLLRLSKTQLDSMLKSLKNNNNSTCTASKYVDAATQSSPELNSNLISLIQKEKYTPKVQESKTIKLLSTSKVNPQVQKTSEICSPIELSSRGSKRLLEEELPGASQCYFDAKRPRREEKLDQSTPASVIPCTSQDAEVARINNISQPAVVSKRLSPLLALHLDAELRLTPVIEMPSPDRGALALPIDEHLQREQVTPPSDLLPQELGTPVDAVFQGEPMVGDVLMTSFEPATLSGLVTPTENSHGTMGTPTLHLSSSSSPVMLLSASSVSMPIVPQATSTPSSTVHFTTTTSDGTVQFYTTPVTSMPGSRQTHLVRSNSPATLKLSTSGIAALQSEVFTTPNSLPSESPINLGAVNVRPVRGIVPSNAILNLVPHLTDSPPGATEFNLLTRSQIPVLDAAKMDQLVHHISQESLFRTEHVVSRVSQILTPQQYSTTIIPHMQTVTPSSSCQPITPGSFFRNTPSAVQHTGLVQQMRLRNTSSAFQLVSNQDFIPEIVSTGTARRLDLTQLSEAM